MINGDDDTVQEIDDAALFALATLPLPMRSSSAPTA